MLRYLKHTICSLVRSKSLGPKIAGAKNLKNINPDTTEYLISLFSIKRKIIIEYKQIKLNTDKSIQFTWKKCYGHFFKCME